MEEENNHLDEALRLIWEAFSAFVKQLSDTVQQQIETLPVAVDERHWPDTQE